MAEKSYRVLVADDHAVVRHGLRVLLQAQPGVQVCGEASTGLEAIDCVKKGKPDLLVLDLTMADMNGLEVMRAVRGESPSTDVMGALLSTYSKSSYRSAEMSRAIFLRSARFPPVISVVVATVLPGLVNVSTAEKCKRMRACPASLHSLGDP
jgi:DNA-binding NarL/FixJ family response regulator